MRKLEGRDRVEWHCFKDIIKERKQSPLSSLHLMSLMGVQITYLPSSYIIIMLQTKTFKCSLNPINYNTNTGSEIIVTQNGLFLFSKVRFL